MCIILEFLTWAPMNESIPLECVLISKALLASSSQQDVELVVIKDLILWEKPENKKDN